MHTQFNQYNRTGGTFVYTYYIIHSLTQWPILLTCTLWPQNIVSHLKSQEAFHCFAFYLLRFICMRLHGYYIVKVSGIVRLSEQIFLLFILWNFYSSTNNGNSNSNNNNEMWQKVTILFRIHSIPRCRVASYCTYTKCSGKSRTNHDHENAEKQSLSLPLFLCRKRSQRIE